MDASAHTQENQWGYEHKHIYKYEYKYKHKYKYKSASAHPQENQWNWKKGNKHWRDFESYPVLLLTEIGSKKGY